MRRALSLFLFACIGLISSGAAADQPELRQSGEGAIQRGLAYLARRQGDDGGWHSQTYGQLKAGPGISSLVLYSFSRSPETFRKTHLNLTVHGFAYFQPGLQKRDTLAAADGSLDYPTYASSLWLASRRNLGLGESAEDRRVLNYLLSAQLLEPRGFEPTHPAYGGWDFLGADDARGITTGSNISLAAYILEAIAVSEFKDPRLQPARDHALAWVLRTQQADGGFAFTPEPASLNNKALFADENGSSPRSYGTATADGLRALIAAGLKPEDEQVQRAIKWLVERPGLEVVPGFEQLPPEAGWQRGLRFYYYASLANAIKHFPPVARETRRDELLKMLVKLQGNDGSWVNESARMREDDPLIATGFAVAALGALLDNGEE